MRTHILIRVQYGLVYPGVGWVLWRAPEYLPQDLVFNIDYLGAQQSSFTLNFSKGASQVIGQYYQLIRLGRRGYRAIMLNLTRTADYLADALQAMGFVIMSERSGRGLPLVAFRFGPNAAAKPGAGAGAGAGDDRHYDEFALAHALRARGWVVPAYTMAPNTNRMKMLRVVVREDFSRSLCDMLLADIKLCLGMLDETDRETIKRQDEYIRTHMTAAGRSKHSKHKAHAYKVANFLSAHAFRPCLVASGTEHGADACIFLLERAALAAGKDGQDARSVLGVRRPIAELESKPYNVLVTVMQL